LDLAITSAARVNGELIDFGLILGASDPALFLLTYSSMSQRQPGGGPHGTGHARSRSL